jgi:hypothetical protein
MASAVPIHVAAGRPIHAYAAAAGGTPVAAGAALASASALLFISASKVMNGVLFVRAKCRGVDSEQWLAESAILHDPVYAAWLSSS